MSGRGTARVPAFQGDVPDTISVEPDSGAASSLKVHGVTNALYSYTWLPTRSAPLPLIQTGVLYEDDDSVDTFPVPLGAIRGAIQGQYTGESGVGGRLGLVLLWGTFNVPVSLVVNVPGLTFPSAANLNEVQVSKYVEEASFPARTDDTPFNFRIPFWVPTVGDVEDGLSNLETPYIPIQILVREAQVGVTPSSSSVRISRITVENYGQAMPVARM
jgi:hypothetical protein